MNSIELMEQRGKLAEEARKILDTAESEGRNPTDEERADFDKITADVENIARQIDEVRTREQKDKLSQIETELKKSYRRTQPVAPKTDHFTGDDYKSALRAWCLAGANEPNISQDAAYRAQALGLSLGNNKLSVRALSKGTTTAGGYTVPTNLSNEINKAMKYYANVRNFCRTLSTDGGADLDWPTVTDVSNVATVTAEAGPIAVNVDPTFGKVTFKSQRYTSPIVKVSIELLQDSVVDIEALLADLLTERIGRKQETDFMTGAGGGSAPNGLVTGAAVGVNLVSGNAITFAKLKALEHSVDIAYRRNGAWLMHDSTFAAIEQLADSQGRPLFLPNLSDGTQYKLFGYPVYISNAFAEYVGNEGDNKPLMLFGDFKQYMVRDVANSVELVRYNELYAGNGQVGFLLAMRAWSDYIGPSGCVKSLNSYDSP